MSLSERILDVFAQFHYLRTKFDARKKWPDFLLSDSLKIYNQYFSNFPLCYRSENLRGLSFNSVLRQWTCLFCSFQSFRFAIKEVLLPGLTHEIRNVIISDSRSTLQKNNILVSLLNVLCWVINLSISESNSFGYIIILACTETIRLIS